MIRVKDYFDPELFHIMYNAPMVGAAMAIETPEELISLNEEDLSDILSGTGRYENYFVVYVEFFDASDYIEGVDEEGITTMLIGVSPTEEIGLAYRRRIKDIVNEESRKDPKNLIQFPGGAKT